MKKCIGIDPGASGGIACLHDNGLVEFHALPNNEYDTYELVGALVCDENDESEVCIEAVRGYIGTRKDKAGNARDHIRGSHMFTFGRNYGFLRGCLAACRVFGSDENNDFGRLHSISPQTWQRKLGILPRKKGMKDNQWKGILKLHAQRLFPQLKITLSTADALLIAKYCQLVYGITQTELFK